jgi:protein ImuB
MFACIHLTSLLAGASALLQNCAASFSPEAELTDPETILFDVSRLSRLYGGLGEIGEAVLQHTLTLRLEANVAVAPNAEAALLAARNFQGLSVIPENAADALRGLDVGNLPLSPQLWEMLEAWGIRTFQDFARLPESGVAARLGPEGVYLHRLARGVAERPLRVIQPEAAFEERVELENALENLEPLLFILSRILNDQCEKLCAHGFSTHELRLKLELERRQEHRRTIRLPVPMRQSVAILKLLQLDLEAHPPQAAILAVHLELKPVQPRTVQNGMFQPVTPAPDKLEVTLARIRALVGEQNAGVPELLNTHRPAPFQLAIRQPATNLRWTPEDPAARKPQVAFRYFQPPLSAQVELEGTRPIRLAAGAIRGNVMTHAGPWRCSGDWWTEEEWNRDEWDVSLNDGAIYRIYRNPDRAWFVEGVYD